MENFYNGRFRSVVSFLRAGVRLVFLACLLGFSAAGVQGKLPVVKVRFANPVYNSSTRDYRVDVEFQSDVPGLEVFGMNVRFMYDDNALEFVGLENFGGRYGAMGKPVMITGKEESGATFGFSGPMEFVNGAVQLRGNDQPVRLSTNGWVRLFQASFKVEDVAAFEGGKCPDLVWDLKGNEEAGFFRGDDGVVITAVDPSPDMESAPVKEMTVDLSKNLETGQLVVTGTNEMAADFKWSVWPNPTPGPVNIDFPWGQIREIEVKVFNALGMEVFRKEFKAGDHVRFNLSNLATGAYQLEVDIEESKLIHKLVVDRR
jgi:hypothetical protein